jgi:transposase-like protein
MSAAKTLPDLIDCLLSDYKKPEDLIGEDSLLKQITKALVERAVEAIETIYPKQSCNCASYSLNQVSCKMREEIATDLRAIYDAVTVEDAEQRLNEFCAKWGTAYPPIAQFWRRNWPRDHPVIRPPAGDSAGDLHHQCD